MKRAFLLVAASALAACGGPDTIAEEAENVSALPSINQSSASPTGGAPADGVPAGNAIAATPAAQIPAALQGRWGLTPADCTSALGDAKGLLVINSDELRFYESRAVPADDVQTSPDSISGDFAFTGEGQQWNKHVSLEIRDGQLVRTERDPVASFRYVRCD
jgi:hypothetical protein